MSSAKGQDVIDTDETTGGLRHRSEPISGGYAARRS